MEDIWHFKYAKLGDWAGIGRGILLFDLAEYEKSKDR